MRARPHFGPAALTLGLGLIAAAFGVTAAFADFAESDWRYVKPIALPAAFEGEDLAEIVLDREVFVAAADGLTDLRIIADGQDEVPFELQVARGKMGSISIPSTIRDLGYVPGEHTTFVAELESIGGLHNEIEIATPSRNFRRPVVVEASAVRVTWAEVAEREIYAFEVEDRGFSARNTRVRYPESTLRYLRVRIGEGPEGAVEVAGANVLLTTEVVPREVSWPVTLRSVPDQTEEGTAQLDVDLGTGGLPHSRIMLQVLDVNFYREVDIQVSDDGDTWKVWGSRSAVFAYDTPRFVGNDLGLTYPETTARFIRLTVHHGDNPPFSVEDVDVYGIQRALVFSAEASRSYSLYYGNGEATKPSYDIGHILPYLETDGLPQAGLDAQEDNPGFFEEPPARKPLTERLPWLLPTAVALVAVVVGALLVGVLRQAKKFLPPPPEES